MVEREVSGNCGINATTKTPIKFVLILEHSTAGQVESMANISSLSPPNYLGY